MPGKLALLLVLGNYPSLYALQTKLIFDFKHTEINLFSQMGVIWQCGLRAH